MIINLDDHKECPIPDKSVGYVYMLLFRGIVVYVGKTTNIANRILEHQRTKTFDKCLYAEFHISEIGKQEAVYISHFNPIYNYSGCSEVEQYKLIDGILFGKYPTITCPIKDVKLKLTGVSEGYCDGKQVCIAYDAVRVVKYNLETNEISRRNMGFSHTRYFDFDEFDFVDDPDTPKL